MIKSSFIKKYIRGCSIRKKIKEDDIFIVSYPKSGNTWVRFLIANLIIKEKIEVNFNTIHDIVPEFENTEYSKSINMNSRFFKSHSELNTRFSKVIYIIRDGRDAYSSFYNYQKNKLNEVYSFKSFLKDKIYKENNSWSSHIESWNNHKIWGSKNFLLIKYEELLKDTYSILKKIIDFSGLSVSEKEIKSAIHKSSFNNMRRLEKEKGRKYQNKDNLAFFTRKGVTGDWKNYFDEESVQLFKTLENNTLIKFGYEDDYQW